MARRPRTLSVRGGGESHYDLKLLVLAAGANVRGLQALRATVDVERHLLTFRQRAEAVSLDRSVVAEHVLAPAVLRDEPKALRVVEPLHGTSCHLSCLLSCLAAPVRGAVPLIVERRARPTSIRQQKAIPLRSIFVLPGGNGRLSDEAQAHGDG